jgi:Zn-dependent protease with chaperone function
MTPASISDEPGVTAGPPGGERFAARWFDGQTAQSRTADVELAADGLVVTSGSGESRRWRFDELVLVRGSASGEPVQLERRGVPGVPPEVLVVDDGRFMGRLRAALPSGSRLTHAGGVRMTARFLFALVAGAVAVIVVAYVWAIPAFSRFAADRVPAQWERRFGDGVVASFAPPERRVPAGVVREPAARIHAQLSAAAEGRARDSRLIVLQDGLVNAFAVPGGTIVVTTGILGTLDDSDELAAVIAHELGHIAAHHPMRSVVRQLSLGALMGLVAGDQSALSGALRTAGELGGLAYSRDDERAADDAAIALLARVGRPPDALARALENLARTERGEVGLSFLSTHPAPRDRIDRIRSGARAGTGGRGPDVDESAAWARMRAALPDSTR